MSNLRRGRRAEENVGQGLSAGTARLGSARAELDAAGSRRIARQQQRSRAFVRRYLLSGARDSLVAAVFFFGGFLASSARFRS